MTEKNILQANKLEELLLKNWPQFIDSSRLIAFCLQNVRDNKEKFPISDIETGLKISPVANLQITLSRFQLMHDGFIIWAEFKIPTETQVAIGTSELFLNIFGDISHIQTFGNLYNI